MYTVGFTTEVECLENIASDSSKYHYAVGADLGSIFNNILNSILWVINNGTVADIMGGQVNLITKEEDISYSPTVLNPTGSLPRPTQPSVDVSGETINWNTGSYVSGSAALTYKVKLDPSVVTGANSDSINVPLNESAVLTYQNKEGKTQALNFPVPTATVEIGTLKVTSTGLPQGVTGTTQSVGNTLVGTADFPQTPYDVAAPIDAPAGYELKGVKVNGSDLISMTAFKAAYDADNDGKYQLPVKKGEQTVEYVYAAKSVSGIRIEKVDGNGDALEGAVFTVNGQEKAADQGDGKNSTSALTFTYGENYTVTESTVPATYNGVSEFVVTLKADCTGLEFVGTAPSGVTLNGLTIEVENIRKAQHNVIVHYVEQGTTNELATQATAVTKYEDEAYDISSNALLNKDDIASWSRVGVRSEDTSKLSGTMGTADVHVYVEYARKAQHNVIVHYVEQGTTNELATQATAVTKYEDEAYDISSNALLNKDDIASWSRVGVRSEDTSKLSGTMGTADVHVYVEYARKAQHNVIVHYVEQGTTNELATQATAVTKYEDEAYDISSNALLNKDDIASWSRVGVRSEDTSKLSGTMGTADVHVYVEYARKAQHNVIVHYVEQGTTNELATQATAVTKYEDEAYDISSNALLNKDDIASWSRVGVRSEDTSKLSGTMGTADVHVYVEYARKAQHNVIVHYVEQGTTNELATQATAVTKYEDEAYDISSNALLNKDDIASWSRVGVRSEDTSKLSGTMGTADVHVYVEYARKAQHNVTVYYWDVTDSENPVALSVNGKTSDSIVKYEDESYNVTDADQYPCCQLSGAGRCYRQ